MPETQFLMIELVAPREAERIRNQGVGDWSAENLGVRSVLALQMSNLNYSLAIALHEAVEQHLCIRDAVVDEAVTAFDALYVDDPDAGELPDAPYHSQHVAATAIEKLFIELCGERWDEYEAAINAAWNALYPEEV